jgi:hypothetical protein
MEWYLYIASFFAGAFLANAVPHFVQGVSGNTFPSPFSKPPGRGLSSPLVNALWGLFNVLVGYVLLRVGEVNAGNIPSLVVFSIGVFAMSVMLSINFQKKERE